MRTGAPEVTWRAGPLPLARPTFALLGPPLLGPALLGLALLGLAGCEASHTLVVDLHSDYRPREEVAGAVIEASRDGTPLARLERDVRDLDSLLDVRLAELLDVPAGAVLLRVELRDAEGALVAEQRLAVELRQSLGVSVLIDRSCEGVTCGDAAAPLCVAEQCVPESCGDGSCLELGCAVSADCASLGECGESVCTSVGVCLQDLDDAVCAPGTACVTGGRCDGPGFGRIASPDLAQVTGLAVGPDGALFVAGEFADTIDLGGGPLSTGGNRDVFLASYTRGGAHRFSTRLGGARAESLRDVAVDAQGRAYLVGDFRSETLVFGDDVVALEGASDSYVAAFDAEGSPRWLRRFGGAGPAGETWDRAESVAVAPDGQLAVAGYFGGEARFGDLGPFVMQGRGYDGFLIGMSADGDVRWAQPVSGPRFEAILDLAFDASGTLYAAGFYEGAFSVGGIALPHASAQDPLALALDGASGEPLWAWTARGPASLAHAMSLAAQDGRIFVAGHHGGELSAGSRTLPNAGSRDVWLAALDATDGATIWLTGLGGPGQETADAIVASPDGAVHLAGRFGPGELPLPDGPLSSAGDVDAFVVSFDASGVPQRAHAVGGPREDSARALVRLDGFLLFGGTYGDAATRGDPTVEVLTTP